MKVYYKARLSRLMTLSLAFMFLLLCFSFAVYPHHSAADASISGPVNCDANAVIYCGADAASKVANAYTNGDGHNSAVSIQNIYTYFHITPLEVQDLATTAVAGSVTSGGEVIVNNQEVATAALTAGRETMPGSTQESVGGTTFYVRPPSVSFASGSLGAYVVMQNGQFLFAILASCGNPVTATPTTQPAPPPAVQQSPNYTITKQVSIDGAQNYGSDVQVHPNTLVDFQIKVQGTGTAPVTNLLVKDTLPNDVTYQSSTLMKDGQPLSQSDENNFFGGGFAIPSLSAGASTTFDFKALAGMNQNNANCNPETLSNVASMTATNLPAEQATATVSVECVQTPAAVVTPASTPPTTQPTQSPPHVTQLPNTGPGNLITIFSAVSFVSAIGYRFYLRRHV